MTEKLFSITRLKCECCTQDAINVLSVQLSKSRSLLDQGKSKGLLKAFENTLNILKRQMREHLQFRANYARDTMDLVKTRTLNVGPSQKRIQTLPYLVGGEKRERQLTEEENKKNKKRKKKA